MDTRSTNERNLGAEARARVAEALLRHIAEHYQGNASKAARVAKIPKGVLHSYTSATSFPSAESVEKILKKWKLDLLSLPPRKIGRRGAHQMGAAAKLSRFDAAIRLKNEGIKIAMKRKGAGIAVGIRISANMKLA